MKYVAWLWTILMLAGAAIAATQGSALGLNPPRNLLLGMVFSAVIICPALWHRDGLLAGVGLPGVSRVLLALALPLACGFVGTPFGLDSFARPPVHSV